MDEHGDFTLSEVSQTERDKHRITSHMWNIEEWYRLTYLQSKGRVTDIEYMLMVTKEDTGVWGEVSQEFGVSTHALLYVHQVAQGAAV